MQTNDKVKSLLGFAIKAGKCVYGIDNVLESRKKKYLIIICNSLSENSKKQLDNVKIMPILMCKAQKLEEITYRTNCKVLAISDKQMADAMLKNYDSSMYDLISEGK